jgi:transcriptional regulator with XRE-family HTH domain
MESTTLGTRLRWAREAAGLKARELDRMAGRPEGHASLIERGARPRIELDTAGAYADALGVSVDWLRNGTGPEPTTEMIRAAVDPKREHTDSDPPMGIQPADESSGPHEQPIADTQDADEPTRAA